LASCARIAHRAGINKERVYSYYGSKSKLFARVLREQLSKGTGEVLLDATDPESLAGYAAVMPQVARMIMGDEAESLARCRAGVVEAARRLATPRRRLGRRRGGFAPEVRIRRRAEWGIRRSRSTLTLSCRALLSARRSVSQVRGGSVASPGPAPGGG